MPCRRNGQGGSAPARLTMPQGGAFFMEEETMADAFRDRMMAATRVVRSEETALKRRIAALYASCARDMGKEVAHYGADSLTGRRAQALQKSMGAYVKALWQDVRGQAEDAIRKGAEIGIETQSGMLGDALHGVGITTRQSFASMFARTQDEAVASVLNGSIYAGKRAGLSRRIWNNETLLGGQIEQLIASAVAQGRSATQLARDLEAFVKPDAMMPDNWNDIYEGLPFAFRVDYNAKRLAVSALNHSYFQGAILAGRENPYAEFLHWELSRSHEIYDVCDTYMEHDEGLGKGNFALDNAPLPHPFCKCTWYIDCNKSLEEIGEELGEWLAGAENPKLERAFGEWRETSGVQLQEISSGAKKTKGWKDRHAERYYEEVRKRAPGVDAKKIAAYTDFTEEQVEDIRQHMFLRIQPLDYGRKMERFEADYPQAITWQRLTEGKGTELDILMLRHEYLELTEMRFHGYNYDEAHRIANQTYDWWKAYLKNHPEEV